MDLQQEKRGLITRLNHNAGLTTYIGHKIHDLEKDLHEVKDNIRTWQERLVEISYEENDLQKNCGLIPTQSFVDLVNKYQKWDENYRQKVLSTDRFLLKQLRCSWTEINGFIINGELFVQYVPLSIVVEMHEADLVKYQE